MTVSMLSPEARLKADRATVRELARRVGTWRIRFDVYDIKIELAKTSWLFLHNPAQLARRVEELETGVITRVDGTFAMILATATVREEAPRPVSTAARKGRGGTAGPRVTKQYVLTNRTHELRVAQPDALDDLERVALAVAVGTLLLGGEPAPTRLITTVLSTVPDLMLKHPTQQTNVLLGRLARRAIPVVTESKAGTARSARWTLCEPLRGVWLDWVLEQTARYESRMGAVHASAAQGAASQSQIVARLVAAATQGSKSSHWPKGHPVTAREITALVAVARQTGDDPHQVVPLWDALMRQDATITSALQAATRDTFADGTHRRASLVRRVEHPRLRSVRYVAAAFDAALEQTWVEWAVLRRETSRRTLDGLAEDWTQAAHLAVSVESCIRAVGLVRQVALRRTLDDRMMQAGALVAPFSVISKSLADERDGVQIALAAFASLWPRLTTLEQAARAALNPFGLSLAEVLDAERPVISAKELAALLPDTLTVDIAPSVLAATAVTIRRAEIARAHRGSRVGAGRVESLRLDRVDAIYYAAESAMLPGVAAIQCAARFLGATLAHVGLLRRVVERASAPEYRVAALGALVMLGDTAHVGRFLGRAVESLQEVATALEATTLVELSWWVDDITNAKMVSEGLHDARQGVKASARRAKQ